MAQAQDVPYFVKRGSLDRLQVGPIHRRVEEDIACPRSHRPGILRNSLRIRIFCKVESGNTNISKPFISASGTVNTRSSTVIGNVS